MLRRFAIVVICACSNSTPSTPPPPAHASNGSADAARALRDKLVAIDAHISVVKNVPEFAEYRDVLRTVEKMKDVVAAEPFIYGEVRAAGPSHAPVEIQLKGVDPDRVGKVLDLSAHMRTGKIEDLATGEPPAIILGDVLADTLEVHAGDQITLMLPVDTGVAAAYPFRVTGILHVGFDFFDEGQAFASLAAVQKVMNRGDQVMGIEVRLNNIDLSAKMAREIERTLGGPPYVGIDWYERNRKLFTTQFGDLSP